MSTKFKVGDKVRVIEEAGCTRVYRGKLGQVFTVTKVFNDGGEDLITTTAGSAGSMFASRFELVKLPRKFTILTPLSNEYAVDLDAQVVISTDGQKYSGYTEAKVADYIARDVWTIIKSKAERDAEAKALADAEAAEKDARKDAVIEAAKELTAALTAYNNAAAKLAAATAAL